MLPLLEINGQFFIDNMQGVTMFEFRIKDTKMYTSTTNTLLHQMIDENHFTYQDKKVDMTQSTFDQGITEVKYEIPINNQYTFCKLLMNWYGRLFIGQTFGFYKQVKFGYYTSDKMYCAKQKVENFQQINKLLVNSFFSWWIETNSLFKPNILKSIQKTN